jgi:hypothetical protein
MDRVPLPEIPFAMPRTCPAFPEQLGGTVAFLCSPRADQITGTAVAVDGAWTAQ